MHKCISNSDLGLCEPFSACFVPVAALSWTETKISNPWNSSRPCRLCRPYKHVASQLLCALLVAKLLLDQTPISSPSVLCCHLLFVPAASATACLASGHLCPVLDACPAPVPLCCDSQVSLSCSTATAQPNFTATALRLWSPSTALQGPERWCFSFDVNIWPKSSQVICFQPRWFSAKSRSVSCVTVAEISEILRTKGKKYLVLILISKNSISNRLWPVYG